MRRLWSVGMRLGLWIALEVGVLTWVATHTSNDFMQKLKQPVYAIEILFFVAAAVISAALALRSAIPGRALRASEATLAAVLVIAGTLLVAAVEPMDATIPLGGFVRLGLPCAYGIGIFAALAVALAVVDGQARRLNERRIVRTVSWRGARRFTRLRCCASRARSTSHCTFLHGISCPRSR